MTIYVIDDHPLMREAIAMVIRRLRPTHEVVELIVSASSLSAAIEKHGTPSLFSLTWNYPDTTGVSGIRHWCNDFVPLAVISANPPSDWEAHCLEAGADVYIDKSAGPAQISALVKGLMLAEDSFEEPVPGQKSSKRQLQLLQLLNKGMSNKEISEELGINEHTVKVHLWRLFRRIEVKSRTQAIYYRQQGLLPSDIQR